MSLDAVSKGEALSNRRSLVFWQVQADLLLLSAISGLPVHCYEAGHSLELSLRDAMKE